MIKFLLALFISTASFAAQPGAVPSVTVSASGANTAQVSISPSQLAANGSCGSAANSPCFSLYGYTSSSTSGNFYVLYKNGTAYTTGSSTKAYCFDITASSGGGNSAWQLVSSQAAITNNSSSALTNGVYQGGATTTYPVLTGPTANVAAIIPGTYVFGDGSHATSAGFQTGTASTNFQIHMDCYEQ